MFGSAVKHSIVWPVLSAKRTLSTCGLEQANTLSTKQLRIHVSCPLLNYVDINKGNRNKYLLKEQRDETLHICIKLSGII